MGFVDLHIHTTASDGLLDPEQVVDRAIEKKLLGISITDHDTVSGIERAIERAKKYKNFLLVPGIELSCKLYGEEVHLLGYFIDYNSNILLDLLDKLKLSRIERGRKIVEKLQKLGFQITFEEIIKVAKDDLVGRPHIARVMIEKGYASSIDEAFEKYIGKNKKAYVDRYKLEVREAINLIHKIGGVAVLAHPGLLKNKHIIDVTIKEGIDGLEVIHSKHSNIDITKYAELADKYNLIKTGGSDYHGDNVNSEPMIGDCTVQYEIIEEMRVKSISCYKGGVK